MAVTGTGEGRVLTVAITGEIDHHQARSIMAELDRYMDQFLPRKLTVDLEGLTFMDSSGIAVILRVYRRVGELNGEMTIRHVPAQAAKVLKAADLDRFIPFED